MTEIAWVGSHHPDGRADRPRDHQDDPPDELTDEQRAAIFAFFADNPDGGYRGACRAAGLRRITRDEARQLILGDPDIRDYRERVLGVAEDTAWKRIGEMAANPDHKDTFRANTYILAAVHGVSEKTQIDVTSGGERLRGEDRSAGLAGVARVLVEIGALTPDMLEAADASADGG